MFLSSTPRTLITHPARIIIADDHPVVLLGTRMALSTLSSPEICITHEASSPDTLLFLLEREPCDLLITDYSMPTNNTPDGIALISYILRNYRETKIIVMTMIKSEQILTHLFELGINGIIDKHHSTQEINIAVSSVLGGDCYISPSITADLKPTKRGETSKKELSAKEFEVVRLLGQGLAGREIAKLLNRSEKTISRQKRTAMQKQGIRSDYELGALEKRPADHEYFVP